MLNNGEESSARPRQAPNKTPFTHEKFLGPKQMTS